MTGASADPARREVRVRSRGKMRDVVSHLLGVFAVRPALASDDVIHSSSPVQPSSSRLVSSPADPVFPPRARATSSQDANGDDGVVVVVTAAGRAINKAIACVEIVKRRVPGLHQVRSCSHWFPYDRVGVVNAVP